jgi:hypothetical protein
MKARDLLRLACVTSPDIDHNSSVSSSDSQVKRRNDLRDIRVSLNSQRRASTSLDLSLRPKKPFSHYHHVQSEP